MRYVWTVASTVAAIVLLRLVFSTGPGPHIVQVRLNWLQDLAPDTHSKGAIVFLHGLMGSNLSWQSESSRGYFPGLMAADEAFDQYRVGVVEYPTDVIGDVGAIRAIGAGVAASLRLRPGEQLIFVAHSMGGPIARHATHLLLKGAGADPHPRVTLISLASPFEGSSLANIAKRVDALDIFSNQVSDLRKGADALQQINANWKNILDKWPNRIAQYAAAEGQPLPDFGYGVIVDRASAVHRVPEENTAYFKSRNHHTICKPDSFRNLDEDAVGSVVKRWVLQGAAGTKTVYGTALLGYPRIADLSAINHQSGEDMYILPGTVVYSSKPVELRGRLLADGTADRPIEFRVEAFKLVGDGANGSRFSHCQFASSSVGLSKEKMIEAMLPGLSAQANKRWKHRCSLAGQMTQPVSRPDSGAVAFQDCEDIWLEQCTFSGCRATWGGAVTANGATATFVDCRFEDNDAEIGGAVYARESTLTFENCVFKGNRACFGGVVAVVHAAAVFLQDCQGWANYAVCCCNDVALATDTTFAAVSTRDQEAWNRDTIDAGQCDFEWPLFGNTRRQRR